MKGRVPTPLLSSHRAYSFRRALVHDAPLALCQGPAAMKQPPASPDHKYLSRPEAGRPGPVHERTSPARRNASLALRHCNGRAIARRPVNLWLNYEVPFLRSRVAAFLGTRQGLCSLQVAYDARAPAETTAAPPGQLFGWVGCRKTGALTQVAGGWYLLIHKAHTHTRSYKAGCTRELRRRRRSSQVSSTAQMGPGGNSWGLLHEIA